MKAYEESTSLSLSQKVLGAFGIVGGIWMIAAPFVLNYGGITVLDAATKKQVSADLGAVTANDIVIGVLLILVGIAALLVTNSKTIYQLQKVAVIGAIVIGIYLMAAPYLFDLLKVAEYLGLDKPNTNDQLVGILSVIAGGYAYQQKFGTVVEVEGNTEALPAAS
jgi:hypothetical protein